MHEDPPISIHPQPAPDSARFAGEVTLYRRGRDRLPSLLHELVDYDMVERTAEGTWVLRTELQSALEAHQTTTTRGERRVFVGLHCEACGVRTMTSMVDGRRLCPPCAQPKVVAELPSVDGVETTGRDRRKRSLHLRRAG
jgi:hypothetical protein